MKATSIIIGFMICIILTSFGQAPEVFNYQAVVRNNTGTVVPNQQVSIRINMLQGSATGFSVYSEEHYVTTNTFGLINLEIGNGNNQAGSFAVINWADGPYFIKVELDITGSSNYITMGTTQLLSVPYALYAGNGDKSVSITGSGATSVTGTYPDFTISSTDSNNTYLPGTGLSLTGTTFNSVWTTNGNDIFNNNSNYIGINTPNPTSTLHLNGSLRITDDTEGSGKFLSSDALGNASWQMPAINSSNGNTNYIPKFITPNSLDNSLIFQNGNKLGIGTTNPTSRLVIIADTTAPDSEPLFEVKDKSGKTVFVVYNDSVHIFVNDFASPGKTENRGSFAVSGKSDTKGLTHPFFVVNFDSTETVNPSQNRVLWYPARNAFLTGRVLVENKDSVGINSFASGFESKAVGKWSQALGHQAIARGDYATAIGKNAIANANSSFAFGINPKAFGPSSFAFGAGAIASGTGSYAIGSQGRDTLGNPIGGYTIADGEYSMALGQGSQASNIGAMTFGMSNLASGKNSQAFGFNTTASGTYAIAIGNSTNAVGFSSIAMGAYTNANGSYSTALGRQTTASGYYSVASGYFSTASGNPAVAMGYYCTASGDYSTAIGYFNTASGTNSVAFGQQTIASNSSSTALGYLTEASGSTSIAMGWQTTSAGFASTAMGWQTSANSHSCTATGYNTTASGYASFSSGYNTKAKSYALFVTGRYNDTTSISASTWNSADPLFIIGNGSADNSRSNAMKVLKNGETYLPSVYNSTVGVTNRDLYIDNTGKLGYVSSSIKYKTNITDMENLDWLYQLRPVNYFYKIDNTNRKEYGLIAEEVEKTNPLFVSYNDDGTVETVNYSKLITPLLKAIQDQKREISELKNKNLVLQTKVDEITQLKIEIEKINSILNTYAKK